MSEEEIKKPLTEEELGLIRELVYAEKVFDMSFQNIAKKLLNEVDLKETKLQQKENIIDKALYWLSENTHYTSLDAKELVLDNGINLKELLEILDKGE